MKSDPLRGLSSRAKAFVLCVMVALMVVFGLAILSTFIIDAGPITDLLRVLAVIGFLAFMFWGQLWFARATKDAVDWRGAPSSRTTDSTRAILDEHRKRQRRHSGSSEEDQ